MSLTTVYTDLELPPGPRGIPQLPKPPGRWWYWVILGAGLLGATFLANIVLRLLQRPDGNSLNPTGSCSWESCLGKDTPSSNCSLNCFQLGLRERLCEAESHQAPGAEGCWLCPAGWQLFATKCYWVSAKTLSWEEAGGDCKDRRAELVVLKSMEEKDFIGTMSKQIPGSWTGLSTIPTQGEEWTWMDGSPLQDDFSYHMPTVARSPSEAECAEPRGAAGAGGGAQCAGFSEGTDTSQRSAKQERGWGKEQDRGVHDYLPAALLLPLERLCRPRGLQAVPPVLAAFWGPVLPGFQINWELDGRQKRLRQSGVPSGRVPKHHRYGALK
ncbi:uncharacterized protein [Anas acuta]|uniref:uncharacterized protein isoform X1 n=1 Tax=Anas acuta TaxID=28680 RepID=UPI0035C8C352